jgi:predicted nucleotidyltransferase component of viral defense system
MIGFGEMRQLSSQWQADITTVERVYVTGWLLKAIFSQADSACVLRGAGVLRYAYAADLPFVDDPELVLAQEITEEKLRKVLDDAAAASGLKFLLVSFMRGAAKVEYIGPLGRRSAAQPRMMLSLPTRKTRLEPERLPFADAFSDASPATVSVVALDEWLGEHVAALAGSPRAREVFDLWFGLQKLAARANPSRVAHLAREIAREKMLTLPQPRVLIAPAHRAVLERAWDSALREVRMRPTLDQVEQDLIDGLAFLNEE